MSSATPGNRAPQTGHASAPPSDVEAATGRAAGVGTSAGRMRRAAEPRSVFSGSGGLACCCGRARPADAAAGGRGGGGATAATRRERSPAPRRPGQAWSSTCLCAMHVSCRHSRHSIRLLSESRSRHAGATQRGLAATRAWRVSGAQSATRCRSNCSWISSLSTKWMLLAQSGHTTARWSAL